MFFAPDRAPKRRPPSAALGLALVLCLSLGPARTASALTIVLDFVTGPTTDIFGTGTTIADYAPYGFTGMNTAQIQAATLAAVTADYLAYPTVGMDASSPLPNGMELAIDFELASGTTPPVNGDSEYFYVAIGDNTTGDGFLGAACLACVRNAAGAGPNFGVAIGDIVGSILVDNIAGLAGLASTDTQRINLLAGTISHEIGHTLSLPHPPGAQANPGASAYSIMGTGASPTFMPNAERVKDRAFAYSEFDQIIDAVGLRDAGAVPEPDMLGLFLLGAALLFMNRRKRMAA
jgi:hypothetical protein